MMTQNEFIKAALNEGVYTENGAVSYGTIGSALLDQFGKAGTARGREYETVWAEQSQLWNEDAEAALKFPFYLRMITRNVITVDNKKSSKVQSGQGARDEAFKRLLWIAANHEEEFYRNLWLLPMVGSWKDLFTLMVMAKNDVMPVRFSLNLDSFYELLTFGLADDYHVDLVKKYLPQIKSNNKCSTERAVALNEIAKDFCKYIAKHVDSSFNYASYRALKTSGKAHTFQKVICSGLYDQINWKEIPGKALLNLVSGKFLENHGLTNGYVDWLKTQPVVKFNGYPFELSAKLTQGRPSIATKVTVDKQFDNLIEVAKKDGTPISGNVLCALDTSGSMCCSVNGTSNVTSYDVCVALGIYFSELNTGEFHNTVAMFDNTSTLMKISGTFSEKLNQIHNTRTAWGGTNFQSLIDLLVNVRLKNPKIPESDFPSTLLVVSDMQFNYCGDKTNNDLMMDKLRLAFSEEFVNNFKCVWWYCAGRATTDFPTTMDKGGQYMLSGFDGSVIKFVLGGDVIDEKTGEKRAKTMDEVVAEALGQEVLSLVH